MNGAGQGALTRRGDLQVARRTPALRKPPVWRPVAGLASLKDAPLICPSWLRCHAATDGHPMVDGR